MPDSDLQTRRRPLDHLTRLEQAGVVVAVLAAAFWLLTGVPAGWALLS